MVLMYLDLGNDTYVQLMETVEHPDAPLDPNWVKAEVYGCHLFQPVEGDPSRTYEQVVAVPDPKGEVPALITNNVMHHRAKYYEAVHAKVNALP